MMSMSKNKKSDGKKPEVKFGVKTDEGYKYSTKINLQEDLSSQIAKLIQEKKAKNELEDYILRIQDIAKKFKNKEKNLKYYYNIGRILKFLNSGNFKNIKPFSVFRRIIEEVPDILPDLDKTRVRDHMMMMHRIGNLDKHTLSRATWNQWYEITKFKNLINNRLVLTQVLQLSTIYSGPDLRNRIRSLLDKRI